MAPGSDDEARRELLLGLGEAQLHAGRKAFRETLLKVAEAAQRAGDHERVVRAALANTRGYFSSAGVVDQQRVSVLEAALGSTPGEDPRRARLLALLAAELIWAPDHVRRMALSDEALELARRGHDAATLAHVLTLRVTAVWWPATLADRLATTEDALARSDALPDLVQRFWAYTWRAVTVAQDGGLDEADRCLEEMRAITARLQHPRLEYVLATQEGWRVQLDGRLADAEQLAARALDIGQRAGEPDAASLYAAQVGPIRWQQGRLGEMADAVAAVAEQIPGVGAFRALRALSELEASREEDARARLRHEARDGFASVQHDPVMLGTLTLWAEVAARAHERDAAAALLARLEPWREQLVLDSLGTMGAVSRSAGQLAASLRRDADADALFAHALERHERDHARALTARTRLEWGLALVARSDPAHLARARELIGGATVAASGLRLPGLQQRGEAALAALEANAPLTRS